ncbi:hypothetical protein [Demequina subtropica]|uniref:hypothetical protein n=1 Tax=Demequina subtropica TaxID=1638989 RepID=UPI0007851203|nr:hypothetical protein [Demequina subtropica]
MLQIASGMYFTEQDCHETVHRRVVYSNGIRMNADDIELPIGTLRFTNALGSVAPLTVEATDRLPKFNPDGTESFHIATSGDELIDDMVDVVAFGLDIVVLSDSVLVESLVAGTRPSGPARGKRLRRVLEPQRTITDDEITSLRHFCAQLLALRRPEFEAAMRAIRRVSDAIAMSSSDVTLSYTLLVAALESLSAAAEVPDTPWENYPNEKRRLIEAATNDLTPEQRDAVHAAVLEAEKFGATAKFRAFVIDHVGEDYYRSGAVGATRPIRDVDLRNALNFAYKARSQSLHELRDLAPELWVLPDDEDTTWHRGTIVLTLEGLHRLCQHVIREFVARASTEFDESFCHRYGDSLPGIVKVRLATQYWIHLERNFDASAVPRLFSALVEMVTATIGGQTEAIADMSNPLGRIEELLPGENKPANQLPMIATYVLWQLVMRPEHRRDDPGGLCEKFAPLLNEPSIYSAAVGILTGNDLPWGDDELAALVDNREKSLRSTSNSTLELPPRLDAALQLELAQRAFAAGNQVTAETRIAKVVELIPGDEALMALEADMHSGAFEKVGLRDFVRGHIPVPPEA